jgi:DNA polymerase III subunit alpha
LLAYWTAWLKTHYPVETITGICSTLDDKDRISIFVTEARRLGITVLPPDINAHTRGFAREGISIRYGLDAIKGIGPQALRAIERGQPYMSYADFAAHGLRADVIYALARSGALDSLVYSRKGLIDSLDDDRSGDSIRCVHKDDSAHGPNGLPCVFDWASEPIIERTGARGQPLKPLIKLPPKKCTRACRHYTPPEIRGIDSATLYAAEELWRMEHEIFGVWLTPAPFARLDEITPGGRQLAREAAALWPSLPPGDHLLPGVISSRRRTYTRGGRPMMWLSVATESSYIDIAVFSPRDDDEPDLLTALRFIPEGSLVLITAKKSRYQAKDGTWRNSAHLRAIRRL